MISSKVILASENKYGQKLVTVVATFPRAYLAEVNTHRVFSRNSASSRARPIKKIIESLTSEPYIPEFTVAKSGMSSNVLLEPEKMKLAKESWNRAKECCMRELEVLDGLGVHKQHANRLVEPFLYQTAIITSAHWNHFFKLRIDENAQPEFHELAVKIKESIDKATFKRLAIGEWHMPFADDEEHIRQCAEKAGSNGEMFVQYKLATSVACCARVSYENHGKIKDLEENIAMHDSLMKNGHWSPFEHQARVYTNELYAGNFIGMRFMQYRKMIKGEFTRG